MLAAYAAMGMGVTASKFFSETGYVEDTQMPPVGSLWLISIAVGAAIALLISILPGNWLGVGLDIPHWLLALGVFCMATGVVPAGAILGLERYREALVAAILSAMVLIIGVYMVRSAFGAMLVFVLAALVQSLGNSVVVIRELGWQRLARHSRLGKRELIQIGRFAGPMLAVTLLAASGSWLVGRIILNSPAGQQGFALYVIGLQWYALALFLPGMISRVLLPRMVRTQLKGSTEGSVAMIRAGSLLTLAITAFIAIIGFIFSPFLLGIYGPSYQANPWLLAAFLVAAIPAAPANTIGNAILAINGQSVWLLFTAVCFLILIAAAYLFMPLGEFNGAFAHGFSTAALSLMAFAYARHRRLI